MPALNWVDVGYCALWMSVPILSCLYFNREIAREWIVASFRATIQLTLLGYVLIFLFQQNRWEWNLLTAVVMLLASAWTVASKNQSTSKKSDFLDILLALALVLLLILLALSFRVWTRGFTESALLIPFIGILLGNSVAGVSLALTQWHRELDQRRHEIEFWICLGATPDEAVKELRSAVVKTSMTAVLHAMAISGIVSIPGQMTGQLLAGGGALSAVQYQLVILFCIASFVFMSTMVLIRVGMKRAFNSWGALVGANR